MTEPSTPKVVARVTADDYLADLGARPAGQIRAMRDECRELAAQLSFQRRVLQGQLDVARAERARRRSGDERPLIQALDQVLADRARMPGPGPAAALVGEPHEFDEVLDRLPLATLPDLDDEALDAAIARAEEEEAAVSRWRRQVLDALDRLQADLVCRYRDGSASVDEVVGR